MSDEKKYLLSEQKPDIHGEGDDTMFIDQVFKRAFYSLLACDWQYFSEQCEALADNEANKTRSGFDEDDNLWAFAFFDLLAHMASRSDNERPLNGRRLTSDLHPAQNSKDDFTRIKKTRNDIKLGLMLEVAGADNHGHFLRAADMVREQLGELSSGNGKSDESLRKVWDRFRIIRKANEDSDSN